MNTNYNERLGSILNHLYQHTGEAAGEAKRLAENAVQYMNHREIPLEKDMPVRLIKGGTYKIKGYYLENNKLPDIRGASAIITEVQEKIVPVLLNREIGFDCIVYNGGGNLFALVPDDCNENIGNLLEEEAQKYLITAHTAYFLSDSVLLSALLGENYKKIIASKENQLTERKKSKVLYTPAPKSQLLGEKIAGVPIEADEMEHCDTYCQKCRKRKAWYQRNGQYICGGCLHKSIVGTEQKSRYMDAYADFIRRHTGASAPEQMPLRCRDFKQIDKDYIAVFYADGNNMGGIIQNFTKLTEMMDFSDFVKETMPQIVYGALHKRGIRNVEFTALGGDDIFIFVPGKKAIRLAVEMIEQYNAVFGKKFPGSCSSGKELPDEHSTLSVGICIAKPSTPVKVMLEAAEEELKKAKELVKERHCSGSLSYVIFDSYEGVTDDRGRWTLLPYSLNAAKQVLKYAGGMKNNAAKTRLRNISEAFRNAESDTEASLFFSYLNAKETEAYKRIQLPQIDGYTLKNGFYEQSDGKTCCIWDDLLDLINFSD